MTERPGESHVKNSGGIELLPEFVREQHDLHRPPEHYVLGDIKHVRAAHAHAASYFRRPVECALEVGVQAGQNAEVIRQVLRAKTMILVDTWESVDWSSIGEGDYSTNEQCYAELLSKYPQNSLSPVKLIRGRSQDVLPTLPADSVDYLYIDGEHGYEACLSDIVNGLRLVKVGGVIAGHDFFRTPEAVHLRKVDKAVREVFGDGCGCQDLCWWQIVTEKHKR